MLIHSEKTGLVKKTQLSMSTAVRAAAPSLTQLYLVMAKMSGDLASRGELALRAQNRAARARARKSTSLNETVSNKMDEVLANREADNLLQIPDNVLHSFGEAVTSDFRLGFILDRLKFSKK
jgi:hypothetical protein